MPSPTTSIDLFLTNRVYGSDQHPRGWDKYVDDDENIHYALLQLLAKHSPAFAQSILRTVQRPKKVVVLPEPERGLFDLAFVADGSTIYCEVKVWASLSDTQFLRQTTYLAENNAKGLYILFTKAADAWPADLVAKESKGRCHVVGTSDLVSALNLVGKAPR